METLDLKCKIMYNDKKYSHKKMTAQTQDPKAEESTIVVRSASEIYDVLMAKIEPELVSTEIPKLISRYVSESAEDRAARAKRYEAAFMEYDRLFAAFMTGAEAQVASFRRRAFASAESQSREEEASVMQGIESSIQSA